MALRRQGDAENFKPPEQQTHPGLPERAPLNRQQSDQEYNRDAAGGGAKAARALDPINRMTGDSGAIARKTQADADAHAERVREGLNRQVNPQDQRHDR